MGSMYVAKCLACGTKFEVNEGGGFTFHLLHCDRCGKERYVEFKELGDLHLRYLKGLDVPYSVATRHSDRFVQENYPGEPISEDEYKNGAEGQLEKFDCGGTYRFEAPPRCPECRSTDLEDTYEKCVCYD